MLTGNQDIDTLILIQLDDRDMTNVCQTSKQNYKLCNNEDFWLKKILYKYPYLTLDLLQKSKGYMSWSEYYIYHLRKINKDNAHDKIIDILKSGKLDQVMIAVNISDQELPYGSMLSNASYDGLLDIVKYLKQIGTDIRYRNDLPVRLASMNGKLDVVKFLVENGSNIHAMDDQSLRAAEENGHTDIVNYINSL
jgi:hypothetical protein